ncbi:YidB family protein [Acetobacter vaccinii]|uniref:DUF937 domain-containing protein n=1 Tax=Acetobacter vaccinii TaxID=2592655 RepID=A0A5C1YN31_9PROT|nr:YidB family protein [Acetobacter vaccinii]QEO16497.1 DUF937 domain-containing protein [Acetobacter vaccinii]
MSEFLNGLMGKVGSLLGVDVQALLQQQAQTLLQPQNIQSMLEKADQAGLGDKVRSWVGHSDNLPATPDEIRSILGSDVVHDLVSRTGLPADSVLTALAHFLPEAVNDKTPQGVVPTDEAHTG